MRCAAAPLHSYDVGCWIPPHHAFLKQLTHMPFTLLTAKTRQQLLGHRHLHFAIPQMRGAREILRCHPPPSTYATPAISVTRSNTLPSDPTHSILIFCHAEENKITRLKHPKPFNPRRPPIKDLFFDQGAHMARMPVVRSSAAEHFAVLAVV